MWSLIFLLVMLSLNKWPNFKRIFSYGLLVMLGIGMYMKCHWFLTKLRHQLFCSFCGLIKSISQKVYSNYWLVDFDDKKKSQLKNLPSPRWNFSNLWQNVFILVPLAASSANFWMFFLSDSDGMGLPIFLQQRALKLGKLSIANI